MGNMVRHLFPCYIHSVAASEREATLLKWKGTLLYSGDANHVMKGQ